MARNRNFTVNDVQEITKAAYMVGVEVVWCNILFKGHTEPVEFHASPNSIHEFSRDMYTRLKAEEFGPLHHGLGLWYRTQPKEQHEIEEEVIAKRNELLIQSDWTELPSGQARLSSDQKAVWAQYRQDLRDITNQDTFPWGVIWPTQP